MIGKRRCGTSEDFDEFSLHRKQTLFFFIVPRHLFTAVFNFVQKLCAGIFVNVLATFLTLIQLHGYNTSLFLGLAVLLRVVFTLNKKTAICTISIFIKKINQTLSVCYFLFLTSIPFVFARISSRFAETEKTPV